MKYKNIIIYGRNNRSPFLLIISRKGSLKLFLAVDLSSDGYGTGIFNANCASFTTSKRRTLLAPSSSSNLLSGPPLLQLERSLEKLLSKCQSIRLYRSAVPFPIYQLIHGFVSIRDCGFTVLISGNGAATLKSGLPSVL